jgi:hypothetical protein
LRALFSQTLNFSCAFLLCHVGIKVGGKFDNGGRFDLRLPYADQGYVSDDADVMGKLSSLFGGGGKKVAGQKVEQPPVVPSRGQQPKQQNKEDSPKKKGWPW